MAVFAVELAADRRPVRLRVKLVPDDLGGDASSASSRKSAEPGATIITDGWKGYLDLTRAGYRHERIVEGRGRAFRDPVPHVHVAIGNAKAWLIGTHKGVWPRHLAVYLDEFVFRYNRRRNLGLAFRTLLGYGASRGPTTWDNRRSARPSKIVYTPRRRPSALRRSGRRRPSCQSRRHLTWRDRSYRAGRRRLIAGRRERDEASGGAGRSSWWGSWRASRLVCRNRQSRARAVRSRSPMSSGQLIASFSGRSRRRQERWLHVRRRAGPQGQRPVGGRTSRPGRSGPSPSGRAGSSCSTRATRSKRSTPFGRTRWHRGVTRPVRRADDTHGVHRLVRRAGNGYALLVTSPAHLAPGVCSGVRLPAGSVHGENKAGLRVSSSDDPPLHLVGPGANRIGMCPLYASPTAGRVGTAEFRIPKAAASPGRGRARREGPGPHRRDGAGPPAHGAGGW